MLEFSRGSSFPKLGKSAENNSESTVKPFLAFRAWKYLEATVHILQTGTGKWSCFWKALIIIATSVCLTPHEPHILSSSNLFTSSGELNWRCISLCAASRNTCIHTWQFQRLYQETKTQQMCHREQSFIHSLQIYSCYFFVRRWHEPKMLCTHDCLSRLKYWPAVSTALYWLNSVVYKLQCFFCLFFFRETFSLCDLQNSSTLNHSGLQTRIL